MKAFLREFRTFAIQGNAVEMAVGLIVGIGFKDLVNSLVNDVVMPPVGLLVGNTDFSNLFLALDGSSYDSLATAQEAGAPTLNYGLFLNHLAEFTIIAFVVFLVVRQLNRLRKEDGTEQETA